MDDALRVRLDRLTWLVAALLLAVLGIGFTLAGAEYITVVFAFGVFGTIIGVVAVSLTPILTSDRERGAGGD
jgi:vacuolar-type H+-ATPase subunit I/STV1